MTMSRQQLVRLSKSMPLEKLRQGGTLSIRSTFANTNLRVSSAWRDDGNIRLDQTIPRDRLDGLDNANDDANNPTDRSSHAMGETGVVSSVASIDVQREEDRMTAIGRKASFLSVSIFGQDDPIALSDFTSITNAEDDDDGSDNGSLASSTVNLHVEVPEKLNLFCDLLQGGSIAVEKKIEGDVSLFTSRGNIVVSKLRGHNIRIESTDMSGTVYAKGLLEAQDLSIVTPGRVRAKQIHGNAINVQVHRTMKPSTLVSGDDMEPLQTDVDDDGAAVDISSLYISGMEGHAGLSVFQPAISMDSHEVQNDVDTVMNDPNQHKKSIRVKSSHGHVVAEAQVPLRGVGRGASSVPVVELGGVNGSCDVAVMDSTSGGGSVVSDAQDFTSAQLHFDSLLPDTVSVVTTEGGDLTLTLDRKLETDLRMVSGNDMTHMARGVLLEDGDGTEHDNESDGCVDTYETIWNELQQHQVEAVGAGSSSSSSGIADDKDLISVETDAATMNHRFQAEGLEFVTATVDNKSMEPDSRFDVETRGAGKINHGGAASQALQSFGASGIGNESTAALPLLVAGSNGGRILVESLSWLGAIARRYGMDENDNRENLGRTATRRGRDLKPKE